MYVCLYVSIFIFIVCSLRKIFKLSVDVGFIIINCLFKLCIHRNEALRHAGIKFPNPVKTGTTIAGIVFKDGVILGADTRATEVCRHCHVIFASYCSILLIMEIYLSTLV